MWKCRKCDCVVELDVTKVIHSELTTLDINGDPIDRDVYFQDSFNIKDVNKKWYRCSNLCCKNNLILIGNFNDIDLIAYWEDEQ